MEKTKQKYVLPKLKQCYSTTSSFDLWMSKGAHNVFALVISFLNEDWQLQDITIRLFETNEATRQLMARNLTKLFDQYMI